MLSEQDLKVLYGVDNFKGVSQRTRTDIIGAIAFDIDNLVAEEGREFTREELSRALNYLVSINSEHLTGRLLNAIRLIVGASAFAGVIALVVCYVRLTPPPYDNPSYNITESELNNLPCGKRWVFTNSSGIWERSLESISEDECRKALMFFSKNVSIIIYALIGVVAGVVAACVTNSTLSFLEEKLISLLKEKKPPGPTLEELPTIEAIFKDNYAREGDNPKACRKFVKAVVRYHIASIKNTTVNAANISEINREVAGNSTTPLASNGVGKGHGSFFSSIATRLFNNKESNDMIPLLQVNR